MTRTTAGGLAIAAVLAIAGCSGGGSSGPEGPAPLVKVLQALPAGDDDLLAAVDYVDYTAIWKVVGWDDDITFDAVEEFGPYIDATRLFGAPAYGGSVLQRRAESTAELGLDPITMRTEVSVGAGPLAVADLAMTVDLDEAGPHLDELAEERDGIREFDVVPSAELGQVFIGVGALAVTESRVVMGSKGDRDLVVAVSKGDKVDDSLADDPQVREVLAQVGDQPRVHLTNRFHDLDEVLAGIPDDAERRERAEDLDAADAPTGAELFGLGIRFVEGDDDTVAVVAVVLFGDDEEAEAAAAWYEAAVGQGTSIRSDRAYEEFFEDLVIEVKGAAVIARWRSEVGPVNMLVVRDLPFLWQGS